MDEPSFRSKVTRAALWGSGQGVVLHALSFVKVIILARLIAPTEFGIFAVALLLLAIIESFSSTGFEDAVIQYKGDIEELLDTAWTIQIIRGAVIFTVLFVMAAPVASFMGSADAKNVVAILGAAPLLRAIGNLGVIGIIREMRFRVRFVLALIDSVVALISTLILVFVTTGDLALAWGLLCGISARCVSSYLLVPRMPRLKLDRGAALKLFNYGKWISLNRMVFVVILRVDSFVVSKVLGAAALGIYQMGARIAEIGSKAVASSLETVAFASLSRLQEDSKRMSRGFAEGVGLVAMLSLPLAAFISAASGDLVMVLLGENWLEVTSVLALLVWSAGIRAVTACAGWMFKATARLGLDLQMSSLRLVVLLISIWPLTKSWGIVGAAWAILLSSCALVPFFFRGLNSVHAGLGIEVTKALIGPILTTVVVFLVVKVSSTFEYSHLLRLAVEGVSFGVALFLGSVGMYLFSKSGPLMILAKFVRIERRGQA